MDNLFIKLADGEPKTEVRRSAASTLLLAMDNAQVLERWGWNLIKRFQLTADFDDVEQGVREAVYTHFIDIKSSCVHDTLPVWRRNAYHAARAVMRKEGDEQRNLGMGGARGRSYRRHLIKQATEALQGEGIEQPTQQQVIDRIEHDKRHLADPKRQGVVVTADDFQAIEAADPDDLNLAAAQDDTAEEATRKYEADQAVRALIAHMRKTHPDDEELIMFVRCWLRHSYEGSRPTTEAIAQETGLPAGRINTLSSRFRNALVGFRRAA